MLPETAYGITVGINTNYPVPTGSYLSQQVVNWAVADGHGNFRIQIDAALIWINQGDLPNSPSNLSWAPLDDAISKLTAAGFTITYPIRGMPTWALQTAGYQATTEPWYMPDPVYVWQYVQAVLSRYNGNFNIPGYGPMRIHKIELGNEEYNIHFTKTNLTMTLGQAVNSGTPYTTLTLSTGAATALATNTMVQFGSSGGSGEKIRVSSPVSIGDTTIHITNTSGGTFTPTQSYAATTTTTTVSGAGTFTITPASMSAITTSTPLVCDAGSANAETITPSSVTGSTFTATFTKAHSGTWTIDSPLAIVYEGLITYTGQSALYNGVSGIFNNVATPPQSARDPYFLKQVLNYCGPLIKSNFPWARVGMGAIWWYFDTNFSDFITGLGSSLQYVEWLNFHFYSNAQDPRTPGGSAHNPSITTAITNMYNAANALGYGSLPMECTEFGWQVPTDAADEATQATRYSEFLNDVLATGKVRRVYLFTYDAKTSGFSQSSLYQWNGTSYHQMAALATQKTFMVGHPLLIAGPAVSPVELPIAGRDGTFTITGRG